MEGYFRFAWQGCGGYMKEKGWEPQDRERCIGVTQIFKYVWLIGPPETHQFFWLNNVSSFYQPLFVHYRCNLLKKLTALKQ